MIDQSFRHFHWTSSLLAALPNLAPYLMGVVVIVLFGSSRDGYSSWIFTGLSIIGIIGATVRKHYSERYRIEEDHLLRKSGFYSTNLKVLPFERVVNVNTTQTSFQKYLGLMTLQVQAASDSAIDLPGVKQEVYEELDDKLQSFAARRGQKPANTSADEEETGLRSSATDEVLHRLSLTDCLKLGLIRNVALAAIFTFVVTVYRHLAERHSDFVGSFVERMTGVDVLDWSSYIDIELAYTFFPWIALRFNHDVSWIPPLVFLSFLFLLFVTVVVACSFILIWFLYSGFRISASTDHVEIVTRGFITTSRKIPRKKIQFIQRIRTLRHRILNSESASFYTTSSSYSESSVANRLLDWLVPIGRPETTMRIVGKVLSHISLDDGAWCGVVESSWRRRFKKHLMVLFPILCVLALISPYFLIAGCLVLPLLVFEAKQFVMGLRYRLTSDAILIERGWWVRKSTTIPLRKVQGVRLSQSFFDTSHGVATLSISTAGGRLKYATASVPYVSYDKAHNVSKEIVEFLIKHRFDG
ncbi:MAG: PH domain-containing protein [Gammaproteobacteria bacterium]|nr:PH domain-containing protein [Gammaproteobacteria bacterium]